jgi:peptide/nickel transport system substrate-binding protein
VGRRRLRLVAAVALAAVVSTGLAACAASSASSGGTPVHGGVLHTLRANPFEGFDLDKGTLNSTYQISQAVLEPLIRVGDDGKSLAPGLARSWKYNRTGDRLTLHLQPNARFSNGRPVRAQDVEFSIRT